MDFPIVASDTISVPARNRAPGWPLEKLKVDEAFVIPIKDNKDLQGRKVMSIRTRLCYLAKQLGIKLSIRKMDDKSLAVMRVA